MRRAAWWSAVVVLCLASCNGCEEEETPPTTVAAPSGTRQLVGGIPVGTIEGVVRLADGEAEPEYATSPFAVPTAGQLPPSCAPAHGADRHPLPMDAARGLANVAVVATGDSEHWIPPGDPIVHEVHIRDCRFDPVTITATIGDRLRVINDLNYPFMPDLGLGMLQSVLPTDPLEAPIDRAGPRQIECGFAAPCGRLQLLTFQQPVHTVSTEGGHFRIENAPADQDLTLTAWHPVVEAGTVTTRVSEGGTTHIDIVVHRFDPPPPEPPRPPLPPGMEIDPGASRDHEWTQEELDRARAEARRLAAEAGTAAPPSTPPPPSTTTLPATR